MHAIRETGTFQYGVLVDGVWHKDFEMRPATLEDVECALEDAGEDACPARIRRHTWARVLTKLGTLSEKAITPELLAELESSEYGVLDAAQESLRKKLQEASAAPAGTCS